ncbi:MAG: GvpL/GvpF family gas vesicle protein [Thermodesulfobacteriota bacterium]
MRDVVLHLFCFADTKSLLEAPGEALQRDGVVRSITVEDVTALAGEAALEDFEGPEAEKRLQDISWLGPQALRHGEVASLIMKWSPVLPARFGALFSSEQALVELIERNYETIRGFLEHTRGSEEWGVKALFSRSDARETLFRDMLEKHSSDLASMTPGLRYFKEQQLRAKVDKEVGSWLKDACGRVSANLHACSFDSVKRPVTTLSLDAEGRETAANWAFLVGSHRVRELFFLVEHANNEFADRGLVFQVSGPWPPYSFVPALVLEEPET